jgi:hypothetical protein
MIRIALVVFALASFAACTPGTGENGKCNPATVGECQVNLDCFVTDADAGADAGGAVCKYVCSPGSSGQPCPSGNYTCVDPPGYCAPDGGTY